MDFTGWMETMRAVSSLELCQHLVVKCCQMLTRLQTGASLPRDPYGRVYQGNVNSSQVNAGRIMT